MDTEDKKNQKKEKQDPASELIERLEAETGQRLGDEGGMVVAGLLGAMSRALGQSPPSYQERDDVVAGLLIQHQMSPEGQARRAEREMLADMLRGGMSPDDLAALLGGQNDHPQVDTDLPLGAVLPGEENGEE